MTKYDYRLSNKLDTDLQKLRCRVNYHALRFTDQIQELGKKLIQRMLEKSRYFIALHLRYSSFFNINWTSLHFFILFEVYLCQLTRLLVYEYYYCFGHLISNDECCITKPGVWMIDCRLLETIILYFFSHLKITSNFSLRASLFPLCPEFLLLLCLCTTTNDFKCWNEAANIANWFPFISIQFPLNLIRW